MCEVLAALPGSAWMPRAGGVSSILRREAACGVQHNDGVRAVGRQESGINLAEERVFEAAARFALANDAPRTARAQISKLCACWSIMAPRRTQEPVVEQGQDAARWTQTASDAASGSEGCRVSAAAVNSEHNSRKTC